MPGLRRRAPENAAEGAAQMALIAEACVQGDLGQRRIGRAQERQGALHPAPPCALGKSFAEVRTQDGGHVLRMDPYSRGGR